MNKIKVGTSVIFLLVLCLFFHNFLVLLNYFLALFLHELGHLIVATKRGYTIKQFNIDLFGMSIDIETDIESKDCFIVNIAGPLTNILLSVICVVMCMICPNLYVYLHIFCIANLSLALFNLLPIYPLDGGKIFRGLIPSEKVFFRLDVGIRVILGAIFSILFICSFPHFNCFYLIFIIFLITSRHKTHLTPIHRKKYCDKISLHHLDEEADLYSSLKLLTPNEYSVFYVGDKCFVEESIYQLALKYPLNSKLKDIRL